MMVMVSNQTGAKFDALADHYYPWGLIGHLYSPDGLRLPQRRYPYSIDNWAYSAWVRGVPWSPDRYMRFCDRVAEFGQPPLWAVVPDVVADRAATIESWRQWAVWLRRRYGWRLAFAAQDGMTPQDVPGNASMVFLGGSMAWKLKTLEMWADYGSNLHVARVNRPALLWRCWEIGVGSVDGTGWWHMESGQYQGLCEYLAVVAGETPRRRSRSLFDEPQGNQYVQRGLPAAQRGPEPAQLVISDAKGGE